MIPTSETIDSFASDDSFHHKLVTWLRSMRDEIDRLQAARETGTDAIKALGELSHAIGSPALEFGRGVTIESALVQFVLDKIKDLISTVDRLTEELAALKPSEDRENDIRLWVHWARKVSIDRPETNVVLSDYSAQPSNVGTSAERFVMMQEEIDEAIALMRSAGDDKALLRELRAWMVTQSGRDGYDTTFSMYDLMRKIDEMLAQPCPEVPETPKLQPAAAVPDSKYSPALEVKAWDDRISAQFAAIATLVKNGDTKDVIELCHGGRVMCEEAADKMLAYLGASKPASVSDDPRWETVAQLAETIAAYRAVECKGWWVELCKALKDIAAKLRGEK